MDAAELVGWNLRRLRVRLQISQEALGLLAGVDRTYVGRLERGLENPTVGILQKLAKALKIQLADLFALPRADERRPSPLAAGRRPAKGGLRR
jgi:transcriptional regulator with XRE-family HTH domain